MATWNENRRTNLVAAFAFNLSLFCAILLTAASASAQDFTGFRGLVTDSSGAVVTGAKITATEENSGQELSTVSNDQGEYEIRGIPPGTYTIEISAPTFKLFKDTGLVVYARSVRRVDVVLEVGAVTSSVTVEGQGSLIQTDTASIQYKTGNQEIYALNIPSWLIYRVSLNPGAESRNQVHGGFANNTNAEQDGIATNAYGSWRAPQETTQEIDQVSLNAAAEYRTSTSVIGIGKKGSNSFHAEVFANYQNAALNALSFGQTSRPPSTPVILWSYEVGGPVYIPKLYNGKNRTFFHFVFQPKSTDTFAFHTNFVMPTTKMRAGDVSEYAAFRGVSIIDPLTNQPFPGNIIPDARISPIAKNILKLLPLPNTGAAGSLVDNFNFTDYTQTKERWWQFRVDQQFGTRNLLSFSFYRYTNVDSEGLNGNPFPNPGFEETDWTNAFSIQDSHTFTPHILNEFGFSFNRQHAIWAPGPIQGKDFLQNKLGITDFGGRTIAEGQGSPRVVMQTLGQQTGVLAGGYNPLPSQLLGDAPFSGTADYTDGYVIQARDNVSINRGKHLFKTGIEVRQQRPYMLNGVTGDTFGRFDFTGAFTGYDYADLLLGLPYHTDLNSVRSTVQAREWEIGAFIQDDWKITRNLTVTPGLRFQHYGVPYEDNGIWYNFDVATGRVVVPDERALKQVVPGYPIPVVTAKEAGYPDRLRNFKAVLVDPRFGLAWRPIEKTVVRAAYGVYHVPFASSAAWATANLFGEIDRAGLLAGLSNGPFQASENFGPNRLVNGVPNFTLSSPFPGTSAGLVDVYSAPVNGRSNAWSYDQQWNVTMERELPSGLSLRLSYVGSKGTDWPYVQNLQVPPASTIPFTPSRRPYDANIYNSINVFQLGGNSTHNGLEIESARQFSRGLYFRVWFSWLKTLNDVQGGLFGSSTGAFIEDPFNRAREKGWQDGLSPISSRWVAVYELPVGRGKQFGGRMPGALNQVLGNWTVVPAFTISTAQRFTPAFSGSDPANVGASGGRPDAICDANGSSGGPGNLWNSACFAVPGPGHYGTAARGSLAGPTIWDTDFNVFKQWRLTGKNEGPYFKVEMYATDLWNHRNSSGPLSTDISSPNFGVFVPSGNRSIYFRLRVGF